MFTDTAPLDAAAHAGRRALLANHVDAGTALYAIRDAAAALQKARSEIENYECASAPGVSDIIALLHDLAGDVAGADAKREDAA